MVLDKKIDLVRECFQVRCLDDWTRIDPLDVLAIDGIGPATLDHIRLYLSAQGRTLLNDQTPGYWMAHLGKAKVVHQMADEDRAEICPFTVLIDSAEQQPFTFQGLRCDADRNYRPLIVETEWRCLGRHPDSLGDYSIDGFVGQVHIERKSKEDFQGTLLGFKSERRERFECELANLSRIPAGLVVVECSLNESLIVAEREGAKPSRTAAKILLRSVLSFQQDYSARWLFCDSRRLAEVATFRFLERYWEKNRDAKKESERLLASI